MTRRVSLAASNRWLRRLAWGALVVGFVVSAGAAVALFLQLRTTTAVNGRATTALVIARRNEAALGQQILHGCVRLNVLRANDNKSAVADYRFIVIQTRLQGSSLRSNFAALAAIGFSKSVLRRAFAQAETALAAERRQARAKEWVRLTNCTAAVLAFGGAYRPPLPVPFSNRFPSPSQFSARNAEHSDPVGSTP